MIIACNVNSVHVDDWTAELVIITSKICIHNFRLMARSQQAKAKFSLKLENYSFIPSDFYRPETKLRKGNVFTSVCQSFCSRGGGLGGWLPSMYWERGCLQPEGIRLTSGRYSSYWNTFLFFDIFRFHSSINTALPGKPSSVSSAGSVVVVSGLESVVVVAVVVAVGLDSELVVAVVVAVAVVVVSVVVAVTLASVMFAEADVSVLESVTSVPPAVDSDIISVDVVDSEVASVDDSVDVDTWVEFS